MQFTLIIFWLAVWTGPLLIIIARNYINGHKTATSCSLACPSVYLSVYHPIACSFLRTKNKLSIFLFFSYPPFLFFPSTNYSKQEVKLFFFVFCFYRNFNIEFNFHSFLQNQFQLCLIYSNVIWWLLEQSYNVCLWGCKGDFWMLLFFLEADEKTVCVCVRARMCAYENLKNCLKYLFIRI